MEYKILTQSTLTHSKLYDILKDVRLDQSVVQHQGSACHETRKTAEAKGEKGAQWVPTSPAGSGWCVRTDIAACCP